MEAVDWQKFLSLLTVFLPSPDTMDTLTGRKDHAMALVHALHRVLVMLFIASNLLLIPVAATIGAALGAIAADVYHLEGTHASLMQVLGGFMGVGLINGTLATLAMMLHTQQKIKAAGMKASPPRKKPKAKPAPKAASTKTASRKAVGKKTAVKRQPAAGTKSREQESQSQSLIHPLPAAVTPAANKHIFEHEPTTPNHRFRPAILIDDSRD